MQAVPGGGGSVVYADNDGTQDVALIDRFGQPLFMYRSFKGYHHNFAYGDDERLKHSGILKAPKLPAGPYADFAPWHLHALESDFLAGRRGVLLRAAKEGQPWAVREVLNRCLGRAEPPFEAEEPAEAKPNQPVPVINIVMPDRERFL